MDVIARLAAATKKAPATASATAISQAEKRLGIVLPALLRRLYTEVADGGVGPGERGLHSLSQLRLIPGGLLEICDWGEDVMSYLWTVHPEAPVIREDPNMDETVPSRGDNHRFHKTCTNKYFAEFAWVEAPSLEEWLTRWLDSPDTLFDDAY